MSNAINDIMLERARQVNVEGWTSENDDEHSDGALAAAGACYALAASSADVDDDTHWSLWPFDEEWWKPKDRRRDLVRAGALIVAEIERIDRAANQTSTIPGDNT